MTTPAKRFGDWLMQAMRRAGLDVDTQMGGGRAAFADAVGVSRSTLTRWLQGTTLPEPTKFEPIAEKLGVPVVQMLVETGIISIKAANLEPRTNVTPEDIADEWGIEDPSDRALLRATYESLTKRSHVQRGVGGHPRSHTLKADEQGDA
jgi:transcriptional regulator with XRE-family HTH domain